MKNQSPLERTQSFHTELATHYTGEENAELRAAAKLLLVALDQFRQHGGSHWHSQIDGYVKLAKKKPEKLSLMMSGKQGMCTKSKAGAQ